jgi:hypothetical protein
MASSTWFKYLCILQILVTVDLLFDIICQNIYIFFNFGISFRDFYFYKTAASPDGLWWVRFQKKNDKMHRSLRSIGLLCCLWFYS